jgi:hypothetical protein
VVRQSIFHCWNALGELVHLRLACAAPLASSELPLPKRLGRLESHSLR